MLLVEVPKHVITTQVSQHFHALLYYLLYVLLLSHVVECLLLGNLDECLQQYGHEEVQVNHKWVLSRKQICRFSLVQKLPRLLVEEHRILLGMVQQFNYWF